MVVDRCMVLPYLEASTLLEQLKREGWTSRTDTASRSILQRDGWSAGVVVREPDRGLCRVEYDGLEGKGAQERSLFGYTMRIDTKRQAETYRYRKDYRLYFVCYRCPTFAFSFHCQAALSVLLPPVLCSAMPILDSPVQLY